MPVWKVQIQRVTILEQHQQATCSQGSFMKYYKDMPNVFGIAADILSAGYEADGRDHDETVQRVLQRSRQVNLS